MANNMLKGTPFRFLARFAAQLPSLQKQVVIYSSQTRAVNKEAQVPWPIIFLLTMRGPKFLFGGTSLPKRSKVEAAIRGMKRRIRTSHLFGDTQGQFNPDLYAPNLEWTPPLCPNQAELAMQDFEANLLHRLSVEAEQQVCRTARGNYTSLDSLAFNLMKTSGWSAVKSDKDSSFVLLTVSDRHAELRRLLEDREHFELVAESPQELFQLDRRVLAAYKTAVTALVDTHEWCLLACGKDRLRRFLLQRVKPGYSCTSRLEFNLKTHKRPITPRELEGSQRNYLQPAQKFASHVLRKELAAHAHWVIQDSAEFVRRAEAGEFHVPAGFRLYSGDIKQFFPSCEHEGLLEAQARLLQLRGYSIKARSSFNQLARLLLQSQVAYAPEVPGFYRRKKGASMGASQASEACDTYVALNHDQIFLTPGILAGIAWFLRFRDDCLFCARPDCMDVDSISRIQHLYRQRGSGLQLDISELDAENAVWLDLHIRVTTSGSLAFSTHIKPTNLGQYIAADSYHSHATLRSWPKAELQRYARNSTAWESAIPPVRRLHLCLTQRGYEVELDGMINFTLGMWHKRLALMQPKARRTQPSFTALVLPFHKCWQKLGIAGMLKILEAQLSQAHIRMLPLKHVYSNPFPHLFIKVRNIHR